jgi:cytoskeletal protein RodZ
MDPVGIGERLRNARQALGLSLEDIESTTRIRRSFLEALEQEAFDTLPSPAYVRGFLRSYASCLGIPPGELLDLYPSSGVAPSVAAPGVHRDSAVEVRITPAIRFSRTRGLVVGLGILVGLGVLVLGYVLYGQIRQFAQTATPSPPPAPQSPVEVTPAVPAPGGPPGSQAPASPSPSVSPSPAPPAPPAPGAPSPGRASPEGGEPLTGPIHAVVVASSGRSWVRAVADGTTVYEGFLNEGEQRVWDAAHTLTVRAGNAGALEVSVNGRSLGRFGRPGEVLERTLSGGATSP